MTPYDYQVKVADEAFDILSKYGMVFLGMEERTGKTLSAIVLAEKTIRNNVLVVTKKAGLMGEKEKSYKTAQEGWYGTMNKYIGKCTKEDNKLTWTKGDTKFTVVNYHGLHTRYKTKAGKTVYRLNYTEKYDLVILDESHNYLSAYPKVGAIWKTVKKITEAQPIIYMSATPNAQGYQLLFNQLRLSNWSPFRAYKDFYRWFDVYGVPTKVRTAYGLQETYKKCKAEVWNEVKHLFITYTRAELGFEHEPVDVIHTVTLDAGTKALYNEAMDTSILTVGDREILLDSSMKERTSLHQLEGGVAKDGDDYIVLENDEKIQAILADFGDSSDNYIMYHYKAERTKLEKYFKHTRLLQATSNAEGVDLSMYAHGIIYSQDWSTARHSQRRARQANKNRKDPINVHYYLVEDAISAQVYETVSINKTNFIDSLYERKQL